MPALEARSRVSGKAVVAVSMGDPLGVGPEVLVKALADPALRRRARFVLHGMGGPMHEAAERAGVEPFWWRAPVDSPVLDTTRAHNVVLLDHDEQGVAYAAIKGCERRGPTKAGGEASFRFVWSCIEDAKRSESDPMRADAIVTAPISKQAWRMAGRGKYPGHTELLAAGFQAKRVVMMFESPKLRVALATAHIPLLDIKNALTIGRVFDPIDLGADACRALGVARPRVAVCGLNPHAGEGGILGDEDERLIAPAVRLAQDAGIDAVGPLPADTLFGRAVDGRFDLVVAMYHDQGLIPVKLLARDLAVNVTLGLPLVRTSPAHGTAYDIAGKCEADAGSMTSALSLAVVMASSRSPEAEEAAR